MKDLDLSISQLRCFVAVVDAGSLAEAGRRLGMATASVSKAIVRLETSAGVKLLHRSTHAVSLTEDGERLIEPAREVLRSAEAFDRSAQSSQQGGAAGWVRVAAPVAFMRGILAPLLAEFSRAHPAIRIDLRASNEFADLAKEGIDLAIRSGALDRAPGHVQSPWFDFPWAVCAAPAYLEGRDPPKTPADLFGHRLIGFRNSRAGQVRRWRFRKPGGDGDVMQFAPEAAMILDDGESALATVVGGAGVACAPLWLAAADLRAGRLVELLRDWRDADMSITFLRQDRRLTPERVLAVMTFLRRRPPKLEDLR